MRKLIAHVVLYSQGYRDTWPAQNSSDSSHLLHSSYSCSICSVICCDHPSYCWSTPTSPQDAMKDCFLSAEHLGFKILFAGMERHSDSPQPWLWWHWRLRASVWYLKNWKMVVVGCALADLESLLKWKVFVNYKVKLLYVLLDFVNVWVK